MPGGGGQVLIWTTCLLSSCGALAAHPEDTCYIARETVRAPLGVSYPAPPCARPGRGRGQQHARAECSERSWS